MKFKVNELQLMNKKYFCKNSGYLGRAPANGSCRSMHLRQTNPEAPWVIERDRHYGYKKAFAISQTSNHVNYVWKNFKYYV